MKWERRGNGKRMVLGGLLEGRFMGLFRLCGVDWGIEGIVWL